MAPDRSTTRAGTDRLSRRPALLAGCAVLLIVLGIAGASWLSRSELTRSEEPTPTSQPTAAPGAPLVVGDGRTVSLLSLGGPDTDPILGRVAANIGVATERVEQFWGTDWPKEIVIVATATDAQFAAAAPGAPAGMAAVAVAERVEADRGYAGGQRIVLAPGAAQMSEDSLRIVLTHELFHYAARADTAPDAPRWLTEGVADYVARPGAPVPEQDRLPSNITDDADFTASGEQLSAAYDRAWSFARFVAERYGTSALRTLYVTAAGPDHTDTRTALRSALGAEPDEVLAGWRQWLADA